MTFFNKFGLPALAILAGAAFVVPGAMAQYAADPNAYMATVQDPPGPVPNPANVPFTLAKDIKWTGTPGRQETAILWGDPAKEGPYGILIKWYPGNFSRPHRHMGNRWVYVVSGNWWVSSSNVYDTRLTYPVPAGTRTEDGPGTVHWDGARAGEKEPAVILLSGLGPVITYQVGPDGKDLPPAAGRGAAPAGRGAAGRGN
jgi:hypothetical protein